MNSTPVSWIWLAGLSSLTALPAVLLGMLDAIAWHHLAWAIMKASMHPAMAGMFPWWLLALLALLTTALGWYLYRVARAARLLLQDRRRMATALAPHLCPMPARDIPPGLGQIGGVTFMTLRDGAPHAFTYGSRRPVIVISQSMQQLLDPQALSAIIVHELYHVRAQDYATQQLFLLLTKTLPWFGLNRLYAQYLTIREIKADRYATAWQQTPDYLIQAMIATIRALKQHKAAPSPGEPAWTSGWQARIEALASPDSLAPHPKMGLLWPFLALPTAGSALFLAACITIACH